MLLEVAGRSNVPCKDKSAGSCSMRQKAVTNTNACLCALLLYFVEKCIKATPALCAGVVVHSRGARSCGIWAKVAKASAALCGGAASLTQHMGAFTLTQGEGLAIGSSKVKNA